MTHATEDEQADDVGGGSREAADVHGAIARLARELHGPGSATADPSAVLAEVTAAAVALLEAVDHAGITLVTRKRREHHPVLSTTAQTDTVSTRFDELQSSHGQGPCFEAVWEHDTIAVPDMSQEERWPEFVAAVRSELPVRSTLSIQLYVTDEDMGALNLYSDRPNAFDRESLDLAHVLATHAAVAISGARRSEQFRSALASRDIIGQAKGMVMERFDIDAVRAFDLIRQLSQNTNTRLVEVAERLVRADHPPAESVEE